ncbi:hypothetical protein PG996_008821 [Apiospora saccharicola]|uniref:Ankyrin repeat protein n=1 Tax=Apiospora saccharicola TaxID=335842 RepID=A0ABR1UZ00_9PEZI
MAGFAKPNSNGASYKEATAALNAICQGSLPNATPGLVQALLDNDADVVRQRRKSTNLMKQLLKRDQEDVRSRLVEDATRNCSADILRLVVQRADDSAINQALPIALDKQDVEKVQYLLARGADASPLCHGFRRAVESGPDDLVNILLRETKGACQECRDLGLVDAGRLGHATKARMLLKSGAALSFQQGAALRHAIQAGHNDAAIAIASSDGARAETELLDIAVGEAYARTQHDVVQRCLQAGARGSNTDRALVYAVQNGQRELARLLVQHRASVNQYSGAAVICAVETGDLLLLRIVLGGKPSSSTLSAAVLQTAEIDSVEVAYHMIEHLLDAGVRGDCLSQVLVRCLGRGGAIQDDENTWLPLVQILLEKGRADVNFDNGKALVQAVVKGWVSTLDVLVRSRASVSTLKTALTATMGMPDPGTKKHVVGLLLRASSNDPAARRQLKSDAVEYAAKALDYHILQFLAEPTLSENELLIGFVSATSTGVHWTTPVGLEVIQFLLGMDTAGPHVDQAFFQATATLSLDAIDLLADYVSPAAFNTALVSITKNSKFSNWCEIEHASLVNSFLERGACADAANNALLHAVDAASSGGGSVLVIETLLHSRSVHVNVNFRSGEALRIAIRAGNAIILAMLMESGADLDAATCAFHEAITAPLDEDTVLNILEVLNSKGGPSCRPDYHATTAGRVLPIVRCVFAHPTSAKLVKQLAKLGCNMEAELGATVHGTSEPAEMLFSAMLSLWSNKVVSIEVVEALIKAKGKHRQTRTHDISHKTAAAIVTNPILANVNCVAKSSLTTPLILAARHCRADIVQLLIKAGAKTDHRDCYGRSALFHASRAGDLDAVKLLLKSKHKTNDGSLHEAARNLHSSVAAALIKNGYSVNFHSSMSEHEGRTPLLELAYRCDCRRKSVEAEDTILAIEKGKVDKVDIFDQWQGQNALFLALENTHPVPVTKALLDTIFSSSKIINNERNVMVVRDAETGWPTYSKSPTFHLKLTADKGNSEVNQELQQLLETKNAMDRFFAPFGSPQPRDAVNIPEDIDKEDKRLRDEQEKKRNQEEKRRIQEFDHQEKLRRQREEGDNSAGIERRKAEGKVEGSQIIHYDQLVRQGEQADQKLRIACQSHSSQMWQKDMMHRGQLQRQDESMAQKYQVTERTNQQKLRFGEQTNQQKLQFGAQTNQQKLQFGAQTNQQKLQLGEETNQQKLRFGEQSNQQKLAMKQSMNKLSKPTTQQRKTG